MEEKGEMSLDRDIHSMSESPGSGVRMCHAQRKTAVYLSRDGQYLVEHEPEGTIRRLLLVHDLPEGRA